METNLAGGSVKKVDETRVPALVGFADVGQVERGQSVLAAGVGIGVPRRHRRRRLVDPRHATHVPVARVQKLLVPNHDRNLDSLASTIIH